MNRQGQRRDCSSTRPTSQSRFFSKDEDATCAQDDVFFGSRTRRKHERQWRLFLYVLSKEKIGDDETEQYESIVVGTST